MARTWFSVHVELLGGRGIDLWPYPARTFAVGPAHTFADLALAINTAFGRWDLAHLAEFNLPGSRKVTELKYCEELFQPPFGPLETVLDMGKQKVARVLKQGEEFQYIFDLGDNWTHRCELQVGKIDPREVLGIIPNIPVAYFGWGSLPDQYGRAWEHDEGEGSQPPKKPKAPSPFSMFGYSGPVPSVDLEAVRAAVAADDADAYVVAIVGCNIDDALSEICERSDLVLRRRTMLTESYAVSLMMRLQMRGNPGDAELAAKLLQQLRAE